MTESYSHSRRTLYPKVSQMAGRSSRRAGAGGGPASTIRGMELTPLTAVSPLDGRYAAKLAPLRPIMSELGYMQRRVQVELAWFIALSDAGFVEFKPLSKKARAYLAGLLRDF